MSTYLQFQRTWRVTWWRAAVIAGAVAVPITPMIAPMAGSAGLAGVGAAIVGLGATISIPALWLLTFGVRLDHRMASRGNWRAIAAHTLGMTGAFLAVIVALTIGPEPLAVWYIFFAPAVAVFAAIGSLAASRVPGSFPPRDLPPVGGNHGDAVHASRTL